MQESNKLGNSIKHDNLSSFNQLYKENYKRLCFHAFKIINSREVAEDIVQDVFVKVWNKYESLNLSDNISSYLYRAVLNESLNYIKKQKQNIYDDMTGQNIENHCSSYELYCDQDDLRMNIRQAINGLPHKTKRVLIMSRKMGFSYKEIANRLNISIKGVEYHMCNALRILRKGLDSILFLIFILCFGLWN